MDVTIFVELISTLGFPVAAVIAMGLFIYKLYKASEIREEKLISEIAENRRINADAIATIGRYADSLTTIEQDIKEIKTDLGIIMGK